MARLDRVVSVETPASAPRYELRVRRHGPVDADYEIWQMPATATPHVTAPSRVAVSAAATCIWWSIAC